MPSARSKRVVLHSKTRKTQFDHTKPNRLHNCSSLTHGKYARFDTNKNPPSWWKTSVHPMRGSVSIGPTAECVALNPESRLASPSLTELYDARKETYPKELTNSEEKYKWNSEAVPSPSSSSVATDDKHCSPAPSTSVPPKPAPKPKLVWSRKAVDDMFPSSSKHGVNWSKRSKQGSTTWREDH
jgi:hypothetical protein